MDLTIPLRILLDQFRNAILTVCMIVAVALLPAWAQRIETHTSDRERIVRVQTALSHVPGYLLVSASSTALGFRSITVK